MILRRVLLTVAVMASSAVAVAATAGVSAAAGTTYYVAPDGSDSAAGTLAAPWATIAHAQSVAQPGDIIYFRGGTYTYTHANSACTSQTAKVDAITLSKSGTSSSAMINYFAYPGEKPVFDFSHMSDDCRIKGFDVTGNYIHLKGLAIEGVPQNNNLNHESWGVWVRGSDDTFEELNIHNIQGTGLFIQYGGGDLVLNCDSHDNYDPHSSNGAGQNSDGFGSHVNTAGNARNVFEGDRSWWNGDDGYDFINSFSPVTVEDSWSWRNGYIPETTTRAPAGNGNGFKMGGYGGRYVSGGVPITVETSVAFLNSASGFYANHQTVADNVLNDTSYLNHPDFNMLGVSPSGAAIGIGYLRNNIAYGGTLLSNMTGTDASHNSWNLNVTMSDAQFQSVSTTGWDAPRQADGSLPALSYLHLAANSSLIDKGVDVGLPYNGAAPDLGAFETPGGGGDTQPPSVPGGLTVTGTTAGSVSLSWSAATDNVGVAGYDVYRDGALAGSTASTSYTDTGLSADTSYTYTVRARDAAGNTSADSNSVTATTSTGGGGTSGELHAVGAGKCLDVPNVSHTNGTQLDIWACNGGSNQAWAYNSSHELTVYGGSKCLDANAWGTTPGTKVQIWDCTGGANQQWNLNSNGTITNVHAGLCLDVTNASTADGALVDLWTCNGGSNQQWHLG